MEEEDVEEEDRSQDREAHCVRAFAVEMHTDIFTRAIVWKFTGKMAEDTSAASILCEPAQSKCTWTCHKKHLVRKFQEKCQTPGIPPRMNSGP